MFPMFSPRLVVNVTLNQRQQMSLITTDPKPEQLRFQVVNGASFVLQDFVHFRNFRVFGHAEGAIGS